MAVDDADAVLTRLIDTIASDQVGAMDEVVRRAAAGENVALIVLPSGRAVVVNLDV